MTSSSATPDAAAKTAPDPAASPADTAKAPSAANAVTQYLADYRPYPFDLRETRLDFDLRPRGTRVRSELDFVRRAEGDLVLDGGAGLRVISLKIDGAEIPPSAMERAGETLTISAAHLPASFTFAAEVEIDPETNTTGEGLYLSGGIFCTQCEAEGFRHITFYPDRPDVMTRFRVNIRSDQPVELSNGERGLMDERSPGSVWIDPWPKPSYLFALVAGDLRTISDGFTTRSGMEVRLNVWVRPGDEDRAGFAMESLIKSMRWDEDVYGREYDLNEFNIVAIDDFNMGAMENKGLNIFNSKLVLASPETATDDDYEYIESVIAHEYFHNWTGNRITCRDWFQLCLKEGLTVFRDQQFTSDMRSAPLKRIADVKVLRARQFPEDAGPLAHPPRPDHYKEINNFYTATVYQKGAEVISMLRRVVGAEGYAKALDLYFERHDGDAATIEDWLSVFEDATGRDLSQFARWYHDAGTPHLTLRETFENGTLTLDLSQHTDPTPGQNEKKPRVIPVAVGLIGRNGDEVLPTTLLELTEDAQSFRFEGLGARPVVSLLRDFSAPVTVSREIGRDGLAHLLAHDTDPFARWEAGHALAMETLCDMAEGKGEDGAYVAALGPLLAGADADPAFAALCLGLPPDDEIAAALAARGAVPDPAAIEQARRQLSHDLALAHEDRLDELLSSMARPGPYRPEPEDTAARALRGAALWHLSRLDGGARAQALYAEAGNMTERVSALSALIAANRADEALADFERRFAGVRLAMDKMFTLAPAYAPGAAALEIAQRLAAREDFDWKNPNRYRALLGGFSGNHAAFHAADGEGYRFVADWLLRMDAVNPQIAARMSQPFSSWRRYDEGRQAHARAQLERILAAPRLSRNLGEMIARISADD
ncbi:MAG: aminopeptidase N [Paracoccus sp. (in: a-proteobacteria)]|nr:aminopeptidase N [Paracoccus sp. (in: a-proteobacteria)]